MTEPTSPAAPRRAALAFIFVTVTLDMLALGAVIPVLPKLVSDFVGGDIARAATIYGLFGTVWASMQFVFSPILGALSDRYGRRPLILLSNLGLGLDYVLMALAPTLHWLFVGRVLSGITSASITAASAYIADVTPPEKRAAGFGLLSAAFGLGFVLGPALGGVLGSFDPRLPFWVAAGLSLTNALYGWLVLPESLAPENRSPRLQLWNINPVGSLDLLRSHPELLGLAIVTFVGFVAHEALPTTFVLYASYRYGWGDRAVGLALAAVGVCSAAVGAGLVRPVVARLGERRTVLVGLLFGTLGFAIYGLAVNGTLFMVALVVTSLWGLAGPPMQSLMSQRVAASEQGALQGAIGGSRGIGFMIGPVLFTLVFAAAIDPESAWHLPGAPFLLAAALLGASAALAWQVTRPR